MTEPTAARGFEVPASVDRVRRQAAMVGVIGLVALVGGAFVNRPQFFQSYLVAFIFWSGVSLGCLALLMVHHLSGGAWGLVVRRILEAAAKKLPLVALLFVPLIFGLEHVYEWAQPELVAKDPILLHKAPFLNTPFWVARTLIYFLLWSGMAFLLARGGQIECLPVRHLHHGQDGAELVEDVDDGLPRIVDDHDLEGAIELQRHALDGAPEQGAPVLRRDDDRNKRAGRNVAA